MTKYPFAPLELLVYSTSSPRDLWVITDGGTQERGRAAAVAHRLGVNVRTVHRWRSDGLSANMADRLAIRADLHPLLVWPEEIAS